MPILTRKFSKKISIKTRVANFMHFQDEMTHLFFLGNEALRSKSVITGKTPNWN